MTDVSVRSLMAVPHVVKGVLFDAPEVEYSSGAGFATPRIDLDALVLPRSQPLPAADVPAAEIIELLVATGEQLRLDPDGLVATAADALAESSPYERRIIENCYQDLHRMFDGPSLLGLLDAELGGADVVDGWRPVEGGTRGGAVRAYPTRMIHVLAGNSPAVAAQTVIRGALMKGVHVLKLPSNDLLSATMILRTMTAVAPEHPVVKSFSAVYWQGGDVTVEGTLFRAQFFDKIAAWGGDSAIRNAAKYLAPGLELISFDPKSSISMIGREAFASGESLADAARRAAIDSSYLNQEACTTSRFQYVEATEAEADRYCELLLAELGAERRYTSAKVPPLPLEVREEIESLRSLDGSYRIFGAADGHGLVVRSGEPVDFYPSGKTVNVVAVPTLDAALQYVNVATQTVGVFPPARKVELRDRLASAGAQRVLSLGLVGEGGGSPGFPHDGFFPLHRFVRWVADEG
jgi:hypothetical protein